jgi:molecular chaperone HscB
MPRDFLMQQMEWRETLEDAKAGRDMAALTKLDDALRAARKAEIAQIGALFDGGDYAQAAQQVRQLMFLEKIGAEIAQLFDQLEE